MNETCMRKFKTKFIKDKQSHRQFQKERKKLSSWYFQEKKLLKKLLFFSWKAVVQLL